MDQTSRSRAYLGWLVVLLATGALAALALRPASAQEGELREPALFAEISYASNCVECHGSDGRGARVPGTDRRAPAIAGGDVDAAYVDLVLRTGRMPPAGDPFDNRARHVFYTDAERQAMVDWMVEEFDLDGEIPEVGEGDVAQGLELFARNCAHCHGNAGAGGTAGQAAWTPRVYDVDEVAVVEAIRVGPFEMPAFSEEQLSDADVASIAGYLRAIEEEQGTPVLGLVELNPVFASGFVGLLAVVLIGSLLYIGGRPVPFEEVQQEEGSPAARTPLPAPTPSDQISMTPRDSPTGGPGHGDTPAGDGPADEKDEA